MFLGFMIAFAIISFSAGVYLFCAFGLKSREVREEYYIQNRKSEVQDFTGRKRND